MKGAMLRGIDRELKRKDLRAGGVLTFNGASTLPVLPTRKATKLKKRAAAIAMRLQLKMKPNRIARQLNVSPTFVYEAVKNFKQMVDGSVEVKKCSRSSDATTLSDSQRLQTLIRDVAIENG